MVVPVASVFVFDLHHQHRPAARDLQGRKARDQFVEIAVDRRQIRAVHAAQTESRLFQQPPGQPAHFPFRADVGAGPQDHVQSQPLRQPRKGGEVPFVLPFKNAFLRLMQVPGDIGFHRIESAGAQLRKPVFPIVPGHAEIMDCAGQDAQRLSFQRKAVV